MRARGARVSVEGVITTMAGGGRGPAGEESASDGAPLVVGVSLDGL